MHRSGERKREKTVANLIPKEQPRVYGGVHNFLLIDLAEKLRPRRSNFLHIGPTIRIRFIQSIKPAQLDEEFA